MSNAQCPMTPDASSRETRPTHWLPNAQCPMTNDSRLSTPSTTA
ncbi:hypothetical protein [Tolypothrix sp. VBCCA 56010]